MVRPANVIAGGEGLLDDLQSMVDPGLEFENHAAITDGLGFENYVPLTPTVDIGDRVTRVQIFDGHQFRGSV
ncbi:hypothetical protein I546_1502 [Mycobacterium kansasii 732]|nr:hypothetical protein I546_1502 [Mycobacterium kansasii 732]KZS65665.1 hypothetical protein A4G27_13765 [Mycobacterium kansasii]